MESIHSLTTTHSLLIVLHQKFENISILMKEINNVVKVYFFIPMLQNKIIEVSFVSKVAVIAFVFTYNFPYSYG